MDIFSDSAAQLEQPLQLSRLEEPVVDFPTTGTVKSRLLPAGPWTHMLWNLSGAVVKEMLNLEFIKQLQQGTLSQQYYWAFQRQDVLYLRSFAQVLRTLSIQATSREDNLYWRKSSVEVEQSYRQLHIDVTNNCASPALRGIATMPMSSVTKGYTDYLLEQAPKGYLMGVAAALPCGWLYCELGWAMASYVHTHHPYHNWLTMYTGDEWDSSTKQFICIVEQQFAMADPLKRAQAARVYLESALWEKRFFQQVLNLV
ncbi:MAG: hypothetical protein Q4P66_02605 [Actinomycetaceae bacterium]|nr:hypothetical protein [Actinomycetaceae bacterium]